MNRKNLFIYAAVATLTLTAFLWRFLGITNNHPFWIDEFSTGNQSMFILNHGLSVLYDKSIPFEQNNLLVHFIVALFFKIFGVKEWVARLPFVMIGSLVPAALFLLTRYIFNVPTAFAAAILSTFSYFQITWSRQARGYVLQQLLVILLIYVYLKLTAQKRFSPLYTALFVVIAILGVLTHLMFYLLLVAMAIHFIIFNRNSLRHLIVNFYTYVAFAVFIGISYSVGYLNAILNFLSSSFFRANNIWYYHSFLWREYGLLTFLGLLGLGFALLQKKRGLSLIFIYLGIHLFFINMVFGHYMSKYLLPIFPFFFIGVAYAVWRLAKTSIPQLTVFQKNKYVVQFSPYIPHILTIVIVLLIVANGHKFVTKPKKYYSINHDFREISNIDYNQVFDIIKSKGELEKGKTAFIDTWPDRSYWYLGQDFNDLYLFRWQNEAGIVNGHPKQTPFTINAEGEKMVSDRVYFIGEAKDLQKAMKKYPRGFIFIDDASMPKDVIDYAEKNLKKEIYLDHYTLDDNPYSIWPATLYSWGVE